MKFLLCVLVSGGVSLGAGAATFTVVNTNNADAGSLRQAILDANAGAGLDTIQFQITNVVRAILVNSNLPAITDPVMINGATQAGYSNAPIVELSGGGIAGGLDGLRVNTSNSMIRALVIRNFTGDGIEINGGGSNVVEGCYVGLDLLGETDRGNSLNGILITNSANNRLGGTNLAAQNVISGNDDHGIRIVGLFATNNQVLGNIIGLNAAGDADRGNTDEGVFIDGAPANRVGDVAAGARNVIAGNNGEGVRLLGLTASNNVIQGNFIGTDLGGTADLGNSAAGVLLDNAPNNLVGGNTSSARNVISGNNGVGVALIGASATNNLVRGNFIGADVGGTLPLANGSYGVHFNTSARFNTVGGIGAGEANLIAFNGNDGVYVQSGTNNTLRANSIFSNGTVATELGIDLGTVNGVTANDAGDGDTGANQLQNFPVLTSAAIASSVTTIQGTLNSRSNTTYTLDFYANQLPNLSGNGEGRFWLGFTNVTTDGSGNVAFTATVATAQGRHISATATDPSGNTSEFSPCVRASSSIAPATFTVVNTNNSGAGSLRQAIFDSNIRVSSSNNRIQFNIPTGGVQTIAPVPALPVISEAVVIDGYSQPSATSNTLADAFNGNLLIRLDGVSAGTGADGLALAASNSMVRGLVIVRFNGDGIHITSAGNTVFGNIIGLDTSGADLGNGAHGVFIESNGANTIGGTTPAARNVISGNGGQGVLIANLTAAGNIVQGNLIGTDLGGTIDRGNSDGVQIDDAPNNVIGGTAPGARNVISGNSDGIQIFTAGATNNLVQGNFIGTDVTGTLAVPNSAHGINFVTAPRFNLAGGTNAGAGNLIAFNGADGVFVSAGTNNAVRANRIHSNGGLGIDIGANNITANDVGDADTGANQLQNFPLLTNAVASVGSTLIQGTLNSLPGTAYALDFFSSGACDPSANGEGEAYLGSASVTTDAGGSASINAVLPATISGAYITATATDPFGNTSEFSPCVFASSTIPPATFNVTTTNDSGAGSLRQALFDSNARVSSNNNTIAFNIPGGGVQTIAPLSELPAIVTPVTIDGFTQPGATANTLSNGNNAALRIRLNGVSAGAASSGLIIVGSNSVVRGLIVARFGDYGIELSGARRTRIEGNFIGIDSDSSDAGNTLDGILVNNSAENLIGGLTPAARNVISGNNDSGILIANPPSSNNVVQGNFIGTDLTGTLDRGNSAAGVQINNAAGNLVGGTAAGARNLISGNNGEGVEIFAQGATNNVVQGNLIGTDITGVLPLANSLYGVYITTSARDNLIGGTNTGAGNVIWFNGDDGVFVQSGTNNAIRANSLSMNGTLVTELGIDLGGSGVTTNDVGDVDAGANQLQNWPVVTNAVANAASTLVQGVLNSRASETYQLDFFANVACELSGNGEGGLWLGAGAVTTDAGGIAVFSFSLPRRVAGRWITATATDSSGNTSEFSPCHRASSTIPPQTFAVVNTNDGGAGSFRQALLDNNAAASLGRNTVAFNIPGSGVRTIAPPTALPAPVEPVMIDGFSQPGASVNMLVSGDNANRLIRLSGEALPRPSSPPVLLLSSNHIVRGLIVVNGGWTGLRLDGSDNVVTGNAIGLDAGGVVGGNVEGVTVNGTRNRLGGAAPSERNLISGNSRGVVLNGSSNSVLGNYIGTDASGTLRRGNTNAGIYLQLNDGTVIGGSDAGAGNLISGNAEGIEALRVRQMSILGNYIGTDVTGTAAISNEVGILMYGGVSNRIGGNVAGAGNLISGNTGEGIYFDYPESTANVIQGNLIGSDITGTANLGNSHGIRIEYGSSNLVGGMVPLAGNTIAFNTRAGTSAGIRLNEGTNNSFLGNSIFSHAHPARAINITGLLNPTPNDPGDTDLEGNNRQNYPELLYSTVAAGQTSVRCSFNSHPNRVYRLEFFRNPECGAFGHGEGKFFVLATNLTTDGNGRVVTTIVLPVALAANEVVTATATDPDGNTSEFSACAPTLPVSAVDLRISVTDAPDPVRLGFNWTNNIVITNVGPAIATGVVVTNWMPTNATFISATSSQGSSSQSGGIVTFNLGSLGVDASAQLQVVMTLANPGNNRSTSTVASAHFDFLPTNNTATTTATAGIADLAFGMVSTPNPVAAGQTLTMNVALTNLGPDTATGILVRIIPAYTNSIFGFNELDRDFRNLGGSATVGTLTFQAHPPAVSWNVSSLVPGATAAAQITMIPAELGTFTNAVRSFGHRGNDPNGGFASVVLTVVDGPGILDLDPKYTAREGNSAATIAVRRISGSAGTVSAQYLTIPGAATLGSDYSATTGTVILTNGQTTGIVSIPLLNDAVPECNEFFRLLLSNPSGGAAVAERTNTMVEISDDDLPPPPVNERPVMVQGPHDVSDGYEDWTLARNGSVVLFTSPINTIVPGDQNFFTDVFVRDLNAGTTGLVSRNFAGTGTGNASSISASLSADGRFISFISAATNLTATPATVPLAAYRHDRLSGTTAFVSLNTNGQHGAVTDFIDEAVPGISASGRFITFESVSGSLAFFDTNATADVFLRDMEAGTTLLVSANVAGRPGNKFSRLIPYAHPRRHFTPLSPDANYVVFQSQATDFLPGAATNSTSLYVRDLINGRADFLLRTASNGGPAVSQSALGGRFSANGKLLVFDGPANTLVTNDVNGTIYDVFIHDLSAGVTRLVSRNLAGTGTGNGASGYPDISANGRYVVFHSFATDLVASDTNGVNDVFRHDLWTGITELVSVTCQGGAAANDHSYTPDVSADGRFVAFVSYATDLVAAEFPLDPIPAFNVFVRDMLLGQTRLVSWNSSGTAAASWLATYGYLPPLSISDDGSTIAFTSAATNVVATPWVQQYALYAVRLTNASPSADLSLTMTSTPNPPVPGNNVTFTFLVTNHGPISATNVVLTHTFPTNAPFISAVLSQGTFTRTNGTLFARFGTLASGQGPTATVTLTVPANPNTLFSVANVTAYQPDSNLANNYGAVSTVASDIVPPLIAITRLGGQLELSWPDTSTGFTLFQTPALNPPVQWEQATNAITQSGGRFRVTINIGAGQQFFRLTTP